MTGKALFAALALIIVLALAACGSSSGGSAGEEGEAGIANPWSEAATLEEACEVAGFDSMSVPEGAETRLGEVTVGTIRCMDGMVEVEVPYPASQLIIRKGRRDFEDVGEGDISGDYTEYDQTWTVGVGDIEVTCFGKVDSGAAKSIWTVGDYSYCILAQPLGGEEDFGLFAVDVGTLVNGIK
jgi:hypothetical protein